MTLKKKLASFIIIFILAIVTLYLPHISQKKYLSLPDNLQLEYSSFSVNVTDVEVQSEILYELRTFAKEQEIVNRGAQPGDIIYIQYTGYINNICYENMENIDFEFELGENNLLDDFESKFIGVYPYSEITFELTFPDDYIDVNLQNEKVRFEVSIYKITEIVYPELTNSFVKKNFNYENTQEYFDYIYQKVYNTKYKMILDDLKEELLLQIVESSVFDTQQLEPLIMLRFEDIRNSYLEYGQLFGYSLEEVYQIFETNEDILFETATYEQKKSDVCKLIIEEENLKPSSKQYQSKCLDYVRELGYITVEDFVRDNGADYLQEKIYEEIVKDYLFSISTLKEY